MTADHALPGDGDPLGLRSLAERLATRAGADALAGRRGLGVGQAIAHDTKSTPTDPVTEFDRAAEATIVRALRIERPDDSIVGEEGADHLGTSSLAWHIDPIDGTANFVYDLPTWCTSVAVVDPTGPLAGAVYLPVTDELFSASRAGGSTLNGVPIRCSAATDLGQALIGTGFSYSPDRRLAQARRLASMIASVRDVRRLGSAAADLCMVASGRLDGYFEEHLNSWDIAAGVLIATEAGARASDFAGRAAGPASMLAATPGVHGALLELIRTVDG